MRETKPGSLGQAGIVYESLREMILSFALAPGTRVTETELAVRFGVSRTPVRDALKRLEAEGELTVLPKQGVLIRKMDIAEIGGYYRVREALEVAALEEVSRTAPAEELRQLAADWDPQRQPGRSDNFVEMAERDEAFHLRLAELAGNPVLTRYLHDITARIRCVRRLDFTDPERITITYREHHGIVRQLLAGDLEAARAALLAHIDASERHARSLTLAQLAGQGAVP